MNIAPLTSMWKVTTVSYLLIEMFGKDLCKSAWVHGVKAKSSASYVERQIAQSAL